VLASLAMAMVEMELGELLDLIAFQIFWFSVIVVKCRDLVILLLSIDVLLVNLPLLTAI
jgi:hypothetical protein